MDNLKKYTDYLLLRNMSDRTVKTYVGNIKLVSSRIGKSIDEVAENDLVDYILDNSKRSISTSSQMLIINSFKSYFKIIHNREFDKSILPAPKVASKQPDILSAEEVQLLIHSTYNLKHKTIFILMYSGALRVSEVVNIKITDIDHNNNKINIRGAKGQIDRFIPLNEILLNCIREYWGEYRTSVYLFEGATGNKYSVKSVQNAVKVNIKKININKKISSHSFRHSSITHMIKAGENLRVVQKIAGHKNINTTAGYIKIYDKDISEAVNVLNGIDL